MILGAAILAGPVQASDAASESDAFFVQMAEEACRNDDFPAFLWPFANSRTVRERHVAPSVFVGASNDSRAISAADYLAADDFPIQMIDYSYVTGASARLFDAEGGRADQLVYVELEFNTAQDERERVDGPRRAPAVFAVGRLLAADGGYSRALRQGCLRPLFVRHYRRLAL